MDTVRVAIIGAGGIAAKYHLPELEAVPNAEVVWLTGRKPARLQLLAERFQVPRWTVDYEEVLRAGDVDAVVISLPHPLHLEYGFKALAAGKHLLIQKPLSTSLAETDEFVNAADQSSLTVMALPFLSRPHVLAARQLVQQGTLGTVCSADARFSHGGPEVYYATIQKLLEEPPVEDLWFFDAERAEVGALFDMGVYAVAHLVALLGSVEAVTCRTRTIAKPTRLEETAVLVLEFANGALGTAQTGWCDGAKTYEFSVHGTDGKLINPSLTYELIHASPFSVTDEDALNRQVPVDLGGFPNISAHQHWVNCILQGKQPPIENIHFARHVTEILLMGLHSAAENRTIPIQSRLPPDFFE